MTHRVDSETDPGDSPATAGQIRSGTRRRSGTARGRGGGGPGPSSPPGLSRHFGEGGAAAVRRPGTLSPDHQVMRVASILQRHAGLRFGSARLLSLRRAVDRALAGGTDFESFVSALESGGALLQDLVDRVTLCDTYFRRDRAHLDLLRQEVVPRILATRRPREIRVWSAGCATGEEAYSLAILLHGMGLERVTTVVATDINRYALGKAEAGEYPSWSFRSFPEDLRERYFTRQGDHFVLNPEVRKMVSLRHLNLATVPLPDPSDGMSDFDVILCRNVLLHLAPDRLAEVGRKLAASLRPGGWLITGPSDPRLRDVPDIYLDVTKAGLVYRKVEASRPRSEVFSEVGPSGRPVPDDMCRRAARLYRVEARDEGAGLMDRAGAGVREWLRVVRELADQGDLTRVGVALTDAGARFPDDAALQALDALVLRRMDSPAAEVEAVRSAIYRDGRLAVEGSMQLSGSDAERPGKPNRYVDALRSLKRWAVSGVSAEG